MAVIAFCAGGVAAVTCVATRMMTRSQPGHVHVSLESERRLRAGVRASRRRAQRRSSSLSGVQVQGAIAAGAISQPATASVPAQARDSSAPPTTTNGQDQHNVSYEELQAIQEQLAADISPDTSPEQAAPEQEAEPEVEVAPEEPRSNTVRQLQFPEDPLIQL